MTLITRPRDTRPDEPPEQRPAGVPVEPASTPVPRLEAVQADESGRDAGSGWNSSLVRATWAALECLLGDPIDWTFTVRLWNGASRGASPAESRFTVVLSDAGAPRRMFLPPSELRLGEAYLRGDFDILGDLEGAMDLIDRLVPRVTDPVRWPGLLAHLLRLPAGPVQPAGTTHQQRLRGGRHTQTRDRAAVRSHYDVGNDFYSLWLDANMVYSCAYFPEGAEHDLDAAQEAKLDYICRKLRLRPGERLLDIGCGWGGLVRWAASHYGVQATGITLSEPQAELARERIAADGMSERARIEVRDYREMPRQATFDKVVSVGMLEHVGREQLRRYFQAAFDLTRPGGLFLAHGIVDLVPPESLDLTGRVMRSLWGEGTFVRAHVFPDGDLVAPWRLLQFAETAGFETRDLESLREHYALTLRHWVRRLEASREEAVRKVGERTYRTWRLYLAGSANAFARGKLGIVQALLARQGVEGAVELPRSRQDLYC